MYLVSRDTKYSEQGWLAHVGAILGMYLVSRILSRTGVARRAIMGMYLVGILSIQDRGG